MSKDSPTPPDMLSGSAPSLGASDYLVGVQNSQATLTQTAPSEENVREAESLVKQSLRHAFVMGENYASYADSDSISNYKRADAISDKATKELTETIASVAAALQRRTDMAERLADALRNVLWLFRGDGSGDEQKARSVLSAYEKEKMG